VQTNKVVETIKWIDSQISDTVKEFVLSNRLFQPGSGKDSDTTINTVLSATHDWARNAQTIQTNPSAVKVIEAFGGASFLRDNAPSDFAKLALAQAQRANSRAEHFGSIVMPFRNMFESLGPWEQLTVPQILRDKVSSAELLSITIDSKEFTSLRTLREVLGHIESVYDTLARLSGTKPESLEIVSIQSGSSVNINLKGSGELLKEFRLLVGDLWSMLRFKSQNDQIANNNVLISSLGVMKEIDKRIKDRSLVPEEAEKMKRALARGMLGLLNCHALPTERAGVEIVDNPLLLEGFNPRLLPSDTESAQGEETGSDGPKRSPSRKKAAKKSTER
jgi:hypothetical protein